ncbi:uncharacterized protein LOC141674077 [Apium graveolens]|uniref:uncharacterized protein LOC141674077 n=1 Tax=Apium graveolens TaxID=4045 RepID=UPI003D7B253D
MGDMNNIFNQSEKKGGRRYPSWLVEGFKEVVEERGLKDMEMNGYQFTWERNHGTKDWVEIKLDRALVTQAWADNFQDAVLTNLEIVEDIWENYKDESTQVKMEKCTRALSEWGKDFTKSFRKRIDRRKKIIRRSNGRRDDYSINQYREENKKLAEILTQQEFFWKQRSK